jgi:hypothetical protein
VVPRRAVAITEVHGAMIVYTWHTPGSAQIQSVVDVEGTGKIGVGGSGVCQWALVIQ